MAAKRKKVRELTYVEVRQLIEHYNPCYEGWDWLTKEKRTLFQVWMEIPNGSWLSWLIANLDDFGMRSVRRRCIRAKHDTVFMDNSTERTYNLRMAENIRKAVGWRDFKKLFLKAAKGVLLTD